jgi:hypothetical protein
MSGPRRSTDGHGDARYEIRLKGHLDGHWATWFDGMSLRHEADGTTVVHGPVADQAALHGLLQRARDIGLPLVSVSRVPYDGPIDPADRPSRKTETSTTQGDRS